MAKKRKKKRKSGARAPDATATPTQKAHGAGPVRSSAPSEVGGPPDAASGLPRSAANALIALFLLFAVATPAHYYLTDAGLDERFAWRMFSTVRQYKCQVRMLDERRDGGLREVALASEIHIAWINMLKRGRPAVGEKVLRTRCAAGDVARARLQRACTAPDGSDLPLATLAIDCDTDTIEETAGTEARL